MSILFADPTEWWIEISPEQQQYVQRYGSAYSTAKASWNAYLNHLCLRAIHPWLVQTYPSQAIAWTEQQVQESSTLWEFVNGTAITIGQKRLIILLSEAIDPTQVEIPQEWIDLPNLMGDYYLFVQFHGEPDQDRPLAPDTIQPNWLHILGYSTHRDIKAIAAYDRSDRTYLLSAENLTSDLNSLWLTLQYCPEAVTRQVIEPLPSLPVAQVQQLVDRLTTVNALPRLALPFELWGAVLNQASWRKRLYRRRVYAQSPVEQLGQWLSRELNRGLDRQGGWRSLPQLVSDGLLGGGMDLALRSHLNSQVETAGLDELDDHELDNNEMVQGKVIEWNRLEEPPVLMLVGVTREPDERLAVKVQIHPRQDQHYVPVNLNLLLLSESGAVLQTVQSGERDNFIQLRKFRCSTGTQFSLQLVLEDEISTETFVV